MAYKLWERFSEELKSLDEAPEPLCSAMRAALREEEPACLLVFGPAFKTLGRVSPATLLAVLEEGWVLVSGLEKGPVQVARVKFAETLITELTVVLLYGRLSFDYLSEGRVRSVDIEFNTVRGELYKRVLRLVLDGIHGIKYPAPVSDVNLENLSRGLTMKFSSVLREFRPPSQRITALVHLEATMERSWHWSWKELSPEAMLILTGFELIYISEEKASSWVSFGSGEKYGYILTYCPLSRLEGYGSTIGPHIGSLELKIRINGRGETLNVGFPREKADELKNFMEPVFAFSNRKDV